MSLIRVNVSVSYFTTGHLSACQFSNSNSSLISSQYCILSISAWVLHTPNSLLGQFSHAVSYLQNFRSEKSFLPSSSEFSNLSNALMCLVSGNISFTYIAYVWRQSWKFFIARSHSEEPSFTSVSFCAFLFNIFLNINLYLYQIGWYYLLERWTLLRIPIFIELF